MMRQQPEFSEQPQATGEGVLVVAWTVGLLLAGAAVNWLAVASAAAGHPFFY